jgi:hypothetical protein
MGYDLKRGEMYKVETATMQYIRNVMFIEVQLSASSGLCFRSPVRLQLRFVCGRKVGIVAAEVGIVVAVATAVKAAMVE